MKKFIYMILLMGIMFIGVNNVEASNATCTYKYKFATVVVNYNYGKLITYSTSYDNSNQKYEIKSFNIKNADIVTDTGDIVCPNAKATSKISSNKQYDVTLTIDESGDIAGSLNIINDDGKEKKSPSSNNIACIYNKGENKEYKLTWDGSSTIVTLTGSSIKTYSSSILSEFTSKDFENGKCPTSYILCKSKQNVDNCVISKEEDSLFTETEADAKENVDNGATENIQQTTTVKNPTSSYSSTSTKQCINCNNTYIPYSLSVLSRNIINLVQLLVPVIIIITGMIELLRAVIAGDEKKMDEVKPTLIRKIIAGVIIFLIFAIVKFGFSFLGSRANATLKCVSYFISEEANSVACPTREELENGTYNSGDSSGESGVDKEVFNYCYDDCVRKHGTGNQQYGQCVQECQETTTASDVQEIKNDIFNYCYDDCVREHGTGNQQYGQCVQECQATTTASDVQAAKTEKYNTCSDSCSSQYGTGNQQYGQCLTTCQAS